MALLVLDASFITKWFKDEIYTEIALKVKDEFVNGVHEIVAPDLILYELANAMRYDKAFDSDLTKQSISYLIELGIDVIIPTEDLISVSIEFAYKCNISIYDAVYVALASKLGATLVTADEKLYEKIKGLNFVKFITNMKANGWVNGGQRSCDERMFPVKLAHET